MKKILSLIVAILMVLPIILAFSSCGKKYDVTLNVYNWGEYFSMGEEDSLDVNKAFEDWYYDTYGVRVKVNYDTFDSNESLRAKLEAGAVSYDVIFPSDYMIEYFIENDLIVKLNYDNIPLFTTNINDGFKNLSYDPKNEYTVPYAYGRVGVIYNANVVAAEDATEWDLLWNEKYSGKILQYSNPRDAFGLAMFKLNLDVNSNNHADWDSAVAALNEQKPLIKSWVMDEVFNMMEKGEAAVASYYAGDYFTMLDNQAEDVDLKFYYPTNSNLYVDAMCIPKCCQNQEVAERYINFLLTEEPAVANAEMTYYACPNKLVYENSDYIEYLGQETYDILYPANFNFAENYGKYAFRNLDKDTLAYMTTLWDGLRIG